ncbi:MAG: amidohydrolase family protein [Pseudonocardiaceae bacterium]
MSTPPAPPRTLISAGQLLTGPAGEQIPDGAVLFEGDTIAAVGSRVDLETQAGPDATRRAFSADHTLMPGLINAHVHLAFDTSPDPVTTLRQADDITLAMEMADHARQLLSAGITTARDLGDRNGLAVKVRDAITAGRIPGPRILAATAPLTTPGGHCWFLGGEVDGETAIRDRIRRNIDAGADLIKVMASGGQMTSGTAGMAQSQFGAKELHIIVDEAHQAGVKVAAHAHATQSIIDAAAAGVDTIEHCTWRGPDGIDQRADTAQQIAEKGIFVCTGSTGDWERLASIIGTERTDQLLGRVRWLADHGVRLIAGTDAGLPGSVFTDIVGALQIYQRYGFSPAHILELVTVNPAEALGLTDHTGQLRAGLSADILVIHGNPLTDLTALRNIELVATRGRLSDGSASRSSTSV